MPATLGLVVVSIGLLIRAEDLVTSVMLVVPTGLLVGAEDAVFLGGLGNREISLFPVPEKTSSRFNNPPSFSKHQQKDPIQPTHGIGK